METKNYKCTQDYLNDEDVICFKKGELYQFSKTDYDWYRTKKNHQGYAHEIEQEEIDETDERIRYNEEHHIFLEDAKKINKNMANNR